MSTVACIRFITAAVPGTRNIPTIDEHKGGKEKSNKWGREKVEEEGEPTLLGSILKEVVCNLNGNVLLTILENPDDKRKARRNVIPNQNGGGRE